MASGKAKEAFKEAKLYFHQEASPENRHLVERTYLLRIQSLIRGGMTSAGREVALSMLEFGVKDPGLMQELILLLPQVGLTEKALALQGQHGSPEVQAQLLLKLADQAVLHPENTRDSLSELREAAGPVRLAFAALDAGQDAQALELLQPVPRSSPMADWRYFVRGLVALRQDDLEQAKANWERLNPQRAAQKIARALLAGADQQSGGNKPEQLRTLEARVFGEPVLERLATLKSALEATDWKRILQLVGPLRQSLNRIDRRYAQRLTEIVLLPLSAEMKNQSVRKAERLIGDFKAALEPLAWDPKWNRFEALLWEGPQGDLNEALTYWRKYLRDLEGDVTGLPGELRQVQALVWRRIGEMSSDLADEEESGGFPFAARRHDPASDELRDQAIEALQQSLRLDPKLRRTYQILIDNYTSWDQPERLIVTLEELLRAFPDDVDALRLLIHHRQLRDEPELVLSYVERLRKLKPLDTRLDGAETWGRLGLARQLALKGRWEEGRAEFARVETSLRGHVLPHRLLARQAAFEFKAGNATQAEEFIERAKLTLKEPTVLWLSLAIEMVRYELPPALLQRFNQEFKTAIARKVSSETAGRLAEVIEGYVTSKVAYPGRAGHMEDVLRYLRRTTRLKYQEHDLRSVCEMLHVLQTEGKLLTSLLKRGLKLFPSCPFFVHLDAERDMDGGPLSFNPRQTRAKLEKALALAQASQNPKDVELIPGIKETLASVQQMGDVMASLPLPFMPSGTPNSPEAFQSAFEMFFNQFGNLDPDDFDDEDEPDPGPRKPPPRRKR